MPATRRRSPGRRVLFLAPEGLPFVGLGVALAVVGAWFSWTAFAVLLGVAVLVALFFRDPSREVPPGAGLVVAPADGRVCLIGPAPDAHGADPGSIQVSIFLSLLNVHVNRAPIAGTITEVAYHPGEFLPAFNDKASLRNEQNRVVIDGPEGRVGLTQIAGLVARRIVFRLAVGDEVERGERVGLIRFGSRTDIVLPSGTELRVALGDRVRGGRSILATLPGAGSGR